MSKSVEKVFIVWGGNKPLADTVSSKLGERGFDGVVGGGTPTDMYIGTQIFSQINQCTRAIILVQNVHQNLAGVFSNNLMFEWGYLTAKMDPRKLHIFLIGESQKSLPSDLAGIWASEIAIANKTLEQTAEEIARMFFEATSRPIEIDKIEIFSRWTKTKSELGTYTIAPAYSEIELAHYLLHSIEVCYYYMEEEELLSLINKIAPVSSVLEFAIRLVKSNIVLFGESLGLTKQLSFDTFAELKSLFESNFDFSNQDINIHLWFKYFCSNRLSLLYILIAHNDEMDTEFKNTYVQKAIESNCSVLQNLNEIAEKYPQEAVYTKLYEGYVHRDLFKSYKYLGDDEKASQHIIAASKARETFYLHYKQQYPNEGYLIKHFGEEYYLSCAESLEYIKDPIEKKIKQNTIRSFLSKIENESGRQHIVLDQLRSAFNIVTHIPVEAAGTPPRHIDPLGAKNLTAGKTANGAKVANIHETLIQSGMAHYKAKKFDAAIVDFTKVIGANPKNAIAWYNRGCAWHGKGDRARARTDFEKAAMLAPDNAKYQETLKKVRAAGWPGEKNT